MATTVPFVTDGDDILEDWGDDVATAVAELQAEWPEGATTWSTPTVNGLTKGNGTETARIIQFGPCKLVLYRFVFGSSSAVTGDLSIVLPTTMAYAGAGMGSGYFESGAGRYTADVYSISTTGILLRPIVTSGTYAANATGASSTIPETWTTGDIINVGFLYLEA